MSGNPDEEFDRIVEGLEFDFDDVADASDTAPAPEPELEPDPELEPELEWFDDAGGYEEPAVVYEPASGPIDLGLNLGWAGALGLPLLMTVATLSGIILPRPVVVACGLVFVACVIYLFSRIPRERPGEGDDDGAVV